MTYADKNPGLAVLNGVLLAAALALVFMYALWSNSLAVARYSIKSLDDRLVQLQEKNYILTAEESDAADPILMREFAQKNNMVEAQHVTYIFENGNVALSR